MLEPPASTRPCRSSMTWWAFIRWWRVPTTWRCGAASTRCTPLATFRAEMDRHLRGLRSSRPLPGVDAVRLPAQERRSRREDPLKNGVPMLPALIAQLDVLARDLGVKALRERDV